MYFFQQGTICSLLDDCSPDLWRISPASEPPGSLGQMSMGYNRGFEWSYMTISRWRRSKSCVRFWATHYFHLVSNGFGIVGAVKVVNGTDNLKTQPLQSCDWLKTREASDWLQIVPCWKKYILTWIQPRQESLKKSTNKFRPVNTQMTQMKSGL